MQLGRASLPRAFENEIPFFVYSLFVDRIHPLKEEKIGGEKVCLCVFFALFLITLYKFFSKFI